MTVDSRRAVARRMRDARDAFVHWLHEHRGGMHPEDLKTEPANYCAWCASCESDSEEYLVAAEARLRVTIDAACADATATVYVECRRFFHRYIARALERRFSHTCPLLALEAAEDIPF